MYLKLIMVASTQEEATQLLTMLKGMPANVKVESVKVEPVKPELIKAPVVTAAPVITDTPRITPAPAPVPVATPAPETNGKITIENLRARTENMIKAGHRDAIKNWIVNIGAKSVALMPAEHQPAYDEFLKTLEV